MRGLFAERRRVGAQLLQDPGDHRVLDGEDADQHAAAVDDPVPAGQAAAGQDVPQRLLEGLLAAVGEAQVPRAAGRVERARSEGGLGGRPHLLQVDPERRQGLGVQVRGGGGHDRAQPVLLDAGRPQRVAAASGVGCERQQQVDRLDLVGPQVARLVLRADDDLPRLVGEPFEHVRRPSCCGRASCGRPAG